MATELEVARSQEANLTQELNTIHAQYAIQEEHYQKAFELEQQTRDLEFEQQIQEQKILLTQAAESKVH